MSIDSQVCASCGRLYPAAARYCAEDGQALYPYRSQAPPPAEAQPGELVLGRYRLQRRLASGGMAVVYQGIAEDEARLVAIKMLRAELERDPVAAERFRLEGAIGRLLSHRSIAKVLDGGALPDGGLVLVMEYLSGEELRQRLKRIGRLPPEEVVLLISQAALALGEAHGRQLVHRDLKPDNLFLCHASAGFLTKILDFGSARDNSRREQKLTVMGTTIGSPLYMAPEQARGLETLDERADVWALGAIAYECLAGAVPFSGVNGPSILLAILTNEPAPLSSRCEIPRAAEQAVFAALSKSPKRRPSSARAFAQAFGAGWGLSGSVEQWSEMSLEALRQAIAAAPRSGTPRRGAAAPSSGSVGTPSAVAADQKLPRTPTPVPELPLNRPSGLTLALVAAAALALGVYAMLQWLGGSAPSSP